MKVVTEADSVISEVADKTGHSRDLVRSVVSDLRHVIDREVSDDVSVLLLPLAFFRSGDPVVPAVVERFTEADWRDPDGLKSLAPRDLAAAIGVAPEVMELHPVHFGSDILALLFEHREVKWEDPAGDPISDVFYAWRASFDSPDGALARPYGFSHVGREADFQRWLINNLDALDRHGYPVELVKAEHRLPTGRRLDLLCRVTRDDEPLRAGDYLIIENKATPVDLPALDQLAGYVDTFQESLSSDERAFGLLISDGTTIRLQNALIDRNFGHLSLSALGYRDHLYRGHLLTAEAETSVGSVPPTDPVAFASI